MKVKLKYNMSSYSGTLNDMTYGSYRNGAVCIGRRYVIPTGTPQLDSLTSVSKNLAKLYKTLSLGYKEDLGTYAKLNGYENTAFNQLAPNRYAIYLKMMYAWAAMDANVDLSGTSIEDMQASDSPVATISDAIDNGLLRNVSRGFTLVSGV